MCATATSFPNGVMAAHKKIQELVTNPKERQFFGLSRPNKDGTIMYKACAEEQSDGEAVKLGLEPFTIKAGNFASSYVTDFMKNHDDIGKAFQELLKNPKIDPEGYCLEMYTGPEAKDMRCLVPLL